MLSPRWKTRLYRITLLSATILAAGGLYALLSNAGGERTPEKAPSLSFIGEHPLQDQPAPDFTLARMNGERFRLSDHRGEVVVVNFWATWCPPCRQEIPIFVDLQTEYGDDGLTFVGISLDEEGFDVVRPFAQEMNINYPLMVDDGTVANRYGGVRALPMSFVVAPDGTIAYVRPGYFPEAELREQVIPLLDEAPPRS
jgi:cytochrome c biogenesis protein CcmG/thiol:disulfide interchange protein DsbE